MDQQPRSPELSQDAQMLQLARGMVLNMTNGALGMGISHIYWGAELMAVALVLLTGQTVEQARAAVLVFLDAQKSRQPAAPHHDDSTPPAPAKLRLVESDGAAVKGLDSE